MRRCLAATPTGREGVIEKKMLGTDLCDTNVDLFPLRDIHNYPLSHCLTHRLLFTFGLEALIQYLILAPG